jgi:deoxyribodipyrimidine photo-lyase
MAAYDTARPAQAERKISCAFQECNSAAQYRMIESTRISALNDHPVRGGRYVLYWMQASQRVAFNHALELAIVRANEVKLPIVVCFGVMDDYPEANERHYAFMLQGLADVHAGLRKRGIRFVVRHGAPHEVAIELSRRAAILICDRGYLRHQRRWRDEVADSAGCRVEQVECDVVVPVEEASTKAEFAARTIRPKINRLRDQYIKSLGPRKVAVPSLEFDIQGDLDVTDPDSTLAKLKIDRSVPRVRRFHGGEHEAHRRLKTFIAETLASYSEGRREPADNATSNLSPYLHFGQISPVEIALRVCDSDAPTIDQEAFLEELIVRRELAINFVHFTPAYDDYDSLPPWARKTLAVHRSDKRHRIYSRQELEQARTDDPFWNAAQREMNATGFMQNSMRMYWGKKVLEWKEMPRKAFAELLYLNNKYFLCGRDPASYANVGWIFGLHDRPWQNREVFGTVRYMNAAGLQRKFDMDTYAQRVGEMEREANRDGRHFDKFGQ